MAGRRTLLQNVKLAELLSAAKTFNLENTAPSYVLLFEDACGWIESVGLSIPSWMVHLATHGSNQSRKGCHPHHMVYVCMIMLCVYIIYIHIITSMFLCMFLCVCTQRTLGQRRCPRPLPPTASASPSSQSSTVWVQPAAQATYRQPWQSPTSQGHRGSWQSWQSWLVNLHEGVSENSVPLNPMVLLIIIPIFYGYFIGNIPNIFRQTHESPRYVATSCDFSSRSLACQASGKSGSSHWPAPLWPNASAAPSERTRTLWFPPALNRNRVHLLGNKPHNEKLRLHDFPWHNFTRGFTVL